ncbi:integrase [Rhodoligotrophos appendicifer]|uniref:tyrosine-type recombinase/integrase n=1 Tax=Rhodoligotrophos appendicifer TaxID=987056 RepID=UPI0019601EBD|nr:tyrosine-type recombinase/integrase [Rhodoligotrophos appendicifer]
MSSISRRWLRATAFSFRDPKATKREKGVEVAIPQGSLLKPAAALKNWLLLAGIKEGPVFRPVAKGGLVAAERLTDRSVALVIKELVKKAGFDPALFAGHSLRAGFVTAALQAGADLFAVMAVSRHVDARTLKTYDRRNKMFRDHAGNGFL